MWNKWNTKKIATYEKLEGRNNMPYFNTWINKTKATSITTPIELLQDMDIYSTEDVKVVAYTLIGLSTSIYYSSLEFLISPSPRTIPFLPLETYNAVGNDNDYISTDGLKEKTIIRKSESAISTSWEEAITLMQRASRPTIFSEEEWQRIIDNTADIIHNWLQQVIEHGWQPYHIFGCHDKAPRQRVDYAGIILLMSQWDSRIVEITEGYIASQNINSGAVLKYYRKENCNTGKGKQYLWESN
jgi:hypothetical protein